MGVGIEKSYVVTCDVGSAVDCARVLRITAVSSRALRDKLNDLQWREITPLGKLSEWECPYCVHARQFCDACGDPTSLHHTNGGCYFIKCRCTFDRFGVDRHQRSAVR